MSLTQTEKIYLECLKSCIKKARKNYVKVLAEEERALQKKNLLVEVQRRAEGSRASKRSSRGVEVRVERI